MICRSFVYIITHDLLQSPVSASQQSKKCCLCCMIGPISLEATLERSAYCCGENVKVKCEIQNGSDQNVWVICRLVQVCICVLVVERHTSVCQSSPYQNDNQNCWLRRLVNVPVTDLNSVYNLRHLLNEEHQIIISFRNTKITRISSANCDHLAMFQQIELSWIIQEIQ